MDFTNIKRLDEPVLSATVSVRFREYCVAHGTSVHLPPVCFWGF